MDLYFYIRENREYEEFCNRTNTDIKEEEKCVRVCVRMLPKWLN